MLRIKGNSSVSFIKDYGAYLRIDAGIGCYVPDPEVLLKESKKEVQDLQRRLNRHAQNPQSTQHKLEDDPQPDEETAEALTSEDRSGAYVLPEADDSLDRFKVFRSLIAQLKPGKMLDLATGHGKFALQAAKQGWEVTAVDARTIRMPDPESEKNEERAKLARAVNWVQCDIRKFPIARNEYNLICIFGVLQHLELEDQIRLLKRCSGTLTILNARVVPTATVAEGAYQGRYFDEPGRNAEERSHNPFAAWGNEKSFRSTEESLLRMVRDCGFTTAFNLRPPPQNDYTFYLCLP